MIKPLLNHGAKLNEADDLGFNALDCVVMRANKENESFLKTLGLKLRVPAHFQDSQATD
jgi:hypothetical protein